MASTKETTMIRLSSLPCYETVSEHMIRATRTCLEVPGYEHFATRVADTLATDDAKAVFNLASEMAFASAIAQAA